MSTKVAEKTATPVAVTPARTPALMRKCSCSGAAKPCGGKCGSQEDAKKLQRKAAHSTPAPSTVPSVVNTVLSAPGRPLDAGARSFMESRFGHDFGNVRVHTGSEAAESARAVGAHAYTVGNDIVFDHGRYDPHSDSGRHLLAHELTHTIQQKGIQHSANTSLGESVPGDRYESEADSVAHQVMSGATLRGFTPGAVAHAPIISRASVTGNAQPTPATTPAKLAAAKLTEVTDADVDPAHTRKFIVEEPFPLPAEKGPFAHPAWQARADNKALVAHVDPKTGDPSKTSSALKQKTASTDEKRAFWLEKVGWSDKAKWTEITKAKDPPDPKDPFKDPAGAPFPYPVAGGPPCDFDHIVELQVGGTNVSENFQPLDPSPNRSSGSQVRGILGAKAAEAYDIYPGISNVILVYTSVTTPPEQCGLCCEIERRARANTGTASEAEGDPYPITSGGSKHTLRIPKGTKTSQKLKIFESEIVANKSGAQIIPGLLLETLERSGAHSFAARFDDRKGTKLAIDVDKTQTLTVNASNTGALTLAPASKTKKIAFHYPYLSKGTITKLDITDNNVSGEGELRPSIGLLSNLVLKVRFSKDELVIISEIPKEKLAGIPGFRVTEASVSLVLWPELLAKGNIGFEAGPKGKPVIVGGVELSSPGGKFMAKGLLKAIIPGLDAAEGEVTYTHADGWSGEIRIGTSQLPGVKSVNVIVGMSEKGYTVSGDILLGVKGLGDEVQLKVVQKPNQLPTYTGKAKINIKRLGQVLLYFSYDGKNLLAEGDGIFDLKVITGKIHVKYVNGKVSGVAKVDIARERLTGSMTIGMTEDYKFFGEGIVNYKVSENLVATAGIILDQNEKVTVKGALTFVKPIKLFEPSKGSYKIFSISIPIPVPGASIGPVGLKAKIEAALTASYTFGPGELQNVKIEATFNPFEANVDPQLKFTGRLYISASGFISGEISGSIALDVLVAEVAGGITLTPSATLLGTFSADMVAQYAKGDYSVEAQLAVDLALKLGLALTAWVKARAGISVFSVETRKDWTLAKISYDPGLKLGVKAPIKYSSREPFKFPSADEIVFTKPTFDVSDMLTRVFGSATAEEREL